VQNGHTLKSWVTLDLFEKVAGRRGVGGKALKTNKSRTNGKVGPTIHPSYLEKFCAPLWQTSRPKELKKDSLAAHHIHTSDARVPIRLWKKSRVEV
jgi:hypothetical protein